MASRAHRWPGDNHPLTGVHGGTAAAALRAVKESKRLLYERAQAAVREAIARNQVAAAAARKDRLRPRRYANGLVEYPPEPVPATPSTLKARVEIRTIADIVWDQCGGCCVYCEKPMYRLSMGGDNPLSFSIDHVLPKSRGGANRLANLAGSHKRCNNDKGSLTGAEYRLVLAARKGAL